MQNQTLKLNPQAERIYEILKDNCWHCPIDWKYSDGHGKRLTDINRYLAPKGLKLDWEWCNCGRHTAQIKKRRIIPLEQPFTHDLKPSITPNLPITATRIAECCASLRLFGIHAKNCQKIQVNTLFDVFNK